MNTANLQLEGLLLAVAALVEAMKKKGLLTAEEVESALGEARDVAADDSARRGEISASNVAAVLFPIRFLMEANGTDPSRKGERFSKLAERVGRAGR